MSRITTPFNAESTAAEVIAGVDLAGKRAVVTGGASGIGLETARALAGAGAQVTLAVRSAAAGQRAAADIQATTGRDYVAVARLDLTDRSTIDAFTAAWTEPLHILVNNAGVLALPERIITTEGWEAQFAANYLPRRAPVSSSSAPRRTCCRRSSSMTSTSPPGPTTPCPPMPSRRRRPFCSPLP